jgi:predicted N-acetyltransferase YhbS
MRCQAALLDHLVSNAHSSRWPEAPQPDMPVLRLDYLSDHPNLIPVLAEWHHRQWSYLSHAATLGQRIARLRQHGRGELPTSFVALLDGAPVGSAAIIANDMTDQETLSPWLANVYVVPAARRQGIGAALVRRAAQEAFALGYHDLYLYTEDQAHFYTGLGWETIDRRTYRGYLMTVMALHLDGSAPESSAIALPHPQRHRHEHKE